MNHQRDSENPEETLIIAIHSARTRPDDHIEEDEEVSWISLGPLHLI